MSEILTSEQRDILNRHYKNSVYPLLSEQEAIKENIGDACESAADEAGLDKAFVKKHLAARFNDKIGDILEEAEKHRFLSE